MTKEKEEIKPEQEQPKATVITEQEFMRMALSEFYAKLVAMDAKLDEIIKLAKED
jgi:hypothetical protein